MIVGNKIITNREVWNSWNPEVQESSQKSMYHGMHNGQWKYGGKPSAKLSSKSNTISRMQTAHKKAFLE